MNQRRLLLILKVEYINLQNKKIITTYTLIKYHKIIKISLFTKIKEYSQNIYT
jgi:hypothetical protein